MTDSQHNDEKHNASMVTTTPNSQHNDKKCNANMVTTTTNSQHNDKKWNANANASTGTIDSIEGSLMDFFDTEICG
jgi:hypothetical protein